MKIKTFYPALFVNDAEAAIKSLETFGFGVAHDKVSNSIHQNELRVLKDAAGHTVCTVHAPGFPQTFTGIRIMVDDFDEAIAEFTKLGYVNVQAKGSADTGTSVATLLRSPEGLFVSVAQHTV